MMKITVFGAGAWGTAVASHMARCHQVVLWGRRASDLDDIRSRGENTRYLKGIPLASGLQVEPDFELAARHALSHPDPDQRLWVIGTPMGALRSTLTQLLAICPIDQWPSVVWLCKGFESDTGLMPHQVVESVLGQTYGGALTGPSFAAEVAMGLPCALTAASACPKTRQAILAAAHHSSMRVYALDDIIGAEVGGAVKNIMAVATGICDGLRLGLNARAALITRGMAEIRRLALSLGAQSETLNGLSGFGDLILTCTGDLSRNRRVGLMLAQGKSLSDILAELGQVAEGVRCVSVVTQLAQKLNIEMPITEAVSAIVHDGKSIQAVLQDLLARESKLES